MTRPRQLPGSCSREADRKAINKQAGRQGWRDNQVHQPKHRSTDTDQQNSPNSTGEGQCCRWQQ